MMNNIIMLLDGPTIFFWIPILVFLLLVWLIRRKHKKRQWILGIFILLVFTRISLIPLTNLKCNSAESAFQMELGFSPNQHTNIVWHECKILSDGSVIELIFSTDTQTIQRILTETYDRQFQDSKIYNAYGNAKEMFNNYVGSADQSYEIHVEDGRNLTGSILFIYNSNTNYAYIRSMRNS